jgi:nucleotidyltransferase/DNA polymerase involved in DNA repair
MDAFFASCELLRHPELAGRPVVVGGSGDPQSRGVVAAASYEARRFGVRSAMALSEAYRRCPQAVFLPADISLYAAMSRRFYAVLRRVTPHVEAGGIDEAYLDVTDVAGSAEEIARGLKQAIRGELKLTASVGAATNRLVAKVASDLDKPDGLRVVRPGREAATLAPLSVRVIPGIGPKTAERLAGLGVDTCGQLAAAPRERLTEEFGERTADWMLEVARGMDDSPLIEEWEPRSMSRERTFATDTSDAAVIRETLYRHLGRLAAELKDEGMVCRTVTVKLRYSLGFVTRTRSQKLARPTDRPEAIWPMVEELTRRFASTAPVRLVGLRLSGLGRKEQEELF